MLSSAFAILAVLGGASAVPHPVTNGAMKLPITRRDPGNSTDWLISQSVRTQSKYYKHLTADAQNKLKNNKFDNIQRRASIGWVKCAMSGHDSAHGQTH